MSLLPDSQPPDVPPGFGAYERGSPFRERAVGPMFEGRDGDLWLFGLRVTDRHLNRRGNVHGGLLATVADVALGHAVGLAEPGARPTTVSLTVDYLSGAGVGCWLEFRTTVVRIGQRLAFTRAEVYADDCLVAHAHGTFAVSREDETPAGARPS